MASANRKASLTMVDLEAMRDLDRWQMELPKKYNENSEIFEELCQEAEAEDLVDPKTNRGRPLRRLSLNGISIHGSSTTTTCNTSTSSTLSNASSITTYGMAVPDRSSTLANTLHRRRHSTFDPRNRAKHRLDHENLQECVRMLEDKQCLRRASFVNNLLEFNVNFDVSSAMMGHDISPALSCSCPVMSYMNDEEEDSVELRMLRCPSLMSIREDDLGQSWESLKDDGETQLPQDGHEMQREYIIQLPPMDEVFQKPRPKRRKPHSYKLLEERLSHETQMDVIKSFCVKEMTASRAHDVAEMPTQSVVQPKALDMDVPSTFQTKRESPVSTRQACARGA